jgi:hypothetical protein
MFSESTSTGPHPENNPTPTPDPEQQQDAVWLENGLNALECLAQRQDYQTTAGRAANNFLKLVHASPVPDHGIDSHKDRKRKLKTRLR